MAKHFKILEKADLARDLFGGEAVSWTEDVATQPESKPEPEPAATPDGPEELEPFILASEVAEPVLPEPAAALAGETPVAAEPEPEAPRIEPVESWRKTLAELVGAPELETCAAIGVCAWRRDPGAAGSTVALAQWIAERASGTTLLVEANAYKPRMARLMQARQRGLTEVFFEQMLLDEAITEWNGEPLRVLPLGRRIDRSRRKLFGEAFEQDCAGWRESFPNLVIELPAADDPILKSFPLVKSVDAVLLAVEPRHATLRSIRKAAKRLQKAGVKVVGCLIEGSVAAGPTSRLDRLGRQLRTSPRRRDRM